MKTNRIIQKILPDMEQYRCKLCASNNYEIVYEGHASKESSSKNYSITDLEVKPSFQIAKCRHCNLIFALDDQDGQAITSSYIDMESDELYVQEERGRRLAAAHLLKTIQNYKKRGRLLDIGCATGFLVDEASKLGYDAQGLEPSHWAAKYAQNKLGLKVAQGSIMDVEFPYNHFDVIVMTDVIEHFADPLDVLIRIRKILKPSGILCVTTPDIDSFLSKFLKAKWWGIKKAHLIYFSKNSMMKMLDRAGFRMVRVGPHPRTFSTQYWLDRLSFYSKFWKVFSKFWQKVFKKDPLVTLNLYDQLEFFIQKKRSLEFIDQDERVNQAPFLEDLKTVLVLPAYNVAHTLARTIKDLPENIVEDIILVDDCSTDETVTVAESLNVRVIKHSERKGYGATQKTCYQKALELNADIVVIIHPDYRYDPKVIPELIQPIKEGRADMVLGSRMIKGGSLEGGMPLWKHNANIFITALQNIFLKTYLSEYHSGFRAFSAKMLKSVDFEKNSDGYIFDSEIIVQAINQGFKIDEIPIRTRYFEEARTVGVMASIGYGFGVIKLLFKYILHDKGVVKFQQFK